MASQEELKKRLKVLMNRAENQVCSDCPERQPRWASLIVPPPGAPPGTQPIGAFCCLECSGSHRRLGVHISFVRSVNLDSWKEKEVLAMENGGNRKVNAIFEARLPPGVSKPHAGADGPTRERFIRDKYERRKFYDPAGFDHAAAAADDDDEDDARSRYSSSVRSTRTAPPIRPPSDAARQRVENRQAQQPRPQPRMERRGSERSKVPKAPRSAPASFDLLDLNAPPTMTMPSTESNFLQSQAPPPEAAPSPKEITVSRNSYAADLLTPMPATSLNTNTTSHAPKNSHDQILSLFNTPPPQQNAMMGALAGNGDFNPLMVNPNMMGMTQQQQQQQAAMMNMMVQPRSNMMNMMQQQQQQHQQQRMLHQRMMQEQQQQAAAAAASPGFGANVMVQPKANVPDAQSMQHAYQNSFHQSFIFTNDGYDNGYGNAQNNNNNNNGMNNNNNNGMGYGGNQLSNQMNMMQQQNQQQNYSGMLMSNSLHGTSSSGGGGGLVGGMGGLSLSSSQDDGGFPSMPMGGNVMASSGPLVSNMHRPMNNRSPPPPQADLPPKPPRKEDPFAQFGMNVFRS